MSETEVTKKYFWLKLKNTFFADPLIRKLRQINDSCAVIYLKMMLYSIENNGVIELRGLEPTAEEEIAFLLSEDITHVRMTISFLRQALMLEEIQNGVFMSIVPTLIGKESTSAGRVRKHRASKALQCNAPVTRCNTEIELEKEKELELEKDSLSKSLSFPKFRKKLADSNFSFTLDNGVADFLPSTKFSISSTGYIRNVFAGEDVNKSDAQKIWDYLYKNQSMILASISNLNH